MATLSLLQTGQPRSLQVSSEGAGQGRTTELEESDLDASQLQDLSQDDVHKIMLKLIELLGFQGLSLGCLYTNSSRSLGRLTLLPSQQPQEFFILFIHPLTQPPFITMCMALWNIKINNLWKGLCSVIQPIKQL